TVSRDSAGFTEYTREGLLKFDLSGLSGRTVSSAELRLRMYDSTTYAGNLVEFRLIDDSSWSEASANGNNLPNGITPPDSWTAETPADAIRAVPPGPGTYMTVELAPLVNQALAAGRTEMSLLVTRQDGRYFIFYTKEHAEAARRPCLRIFLKDEPAPTATRKPLQETLVSGFNSTTMDNVYYAGDFTNHFQIGCSANNQVLYGVMLFDPSKLADAAFVRLRVKSKNNLPAGNGILRVATWTTDAWNETNLTWNTTGPWFPQPASVRDGTALPGEVASVFLSQPKSDKPWFDVDVTAAAREAAQAGRMLTLGLFSNIAWPEFYKGASDYPAVLVFPDPDATFGNKMTCSLGEGDGKPAMCLEWSPSPAAGATYTVERRKDNTWVMVAAGLVEPTCLDSKAEPYVEQTYRITATANGTSESVVKSVTLVPTVKVFACADTYVRNGGNNNTSFGTESMLVHKYEGDATGGGVREAFYRFDLSEMPSDFVSATLKLHPTGNDGGDIANAHFDLLEYPDFEWTDTTAPTWNNVFGNGYATPKARADMSDEKRMDEKLLGTYHCNERGRLLADVPVTFDVTAAIKEAKAAGSSHITLHSATYSNSTWNFGIISRERSQGVSCAAQIVFALKNWTVSGTVITIR
ncbi:MAG: DNRLRE domain-containing protein, partial [Kiritimatiellae bacterium]|nr:DNRLRE domain-containing protein [Kiritimatiellia bacterium]